MLFFISAGFYKSGVSIGNMTFVSVVDIKRRTGVKQILVLCNGVLRLMSNSMMLCKNKKPGKRSGKISMIILITAWHILAEIETLEIPGIHYF
jgi:hypothetical protein